MSEVKTYCFPEGGSFGGNGMEGMLLGSMMNGGGGFGGNGMWNNPIWAIVFLAALQNGGFGFGGGNNSQLSQIQDTLNTNQGNTLLMDAIKGNANAIGQLANALNCDINAVQGAINNVQSAICSVGNQVGMSSAQIVNAIQSGNMQLANSLQNCCCEVKTETLKMGYENQINNLNQTNAMTKGFGDVQYATQMQTNALAQNNDANTRAVLAKIDAVQDEAKNAKIAELTAQLASVNARAERAAELAPIYAQLNDIKCKQPETVTVPYSPITPVPSCVAWNAALYGGYGYPYAQQGNVFS